MQKNCLRPFQQHLFQSKFIVTVTAKSNHSARIYFLEKISIISVYYLQTSHRDRVISSKAISYSQ